MFLQRNFSQDKAWQIKKSLTPKNVLQRNFAKDKKNREQQDRSVLKIHKGLMNDNF